MKKSDFITIAIIIILLMPFFVFTEVYNAYIYLSSNYALLMAFLKFAILASFGEMLALRIKKGSYILENHGYLPKAIVWGLFGIWIAVAMSVFKYGVPAFLEKYTIFEGVKIAMTSEFTFMKLIGAFFISSVMNIFFAPVFMTVHKVTDTHINSYNGTMRSLIKPVQVKNIINELDWKTHWGFVLKKTIPLFWIPAHTITFILPDVFQVLFAALCSIALGLILSVANLKKTTNL